MNVCMKYWKNMELRNMSTDDMIIEKVKVVELTFEDGTKKLCRGGEEAVLRAWGTYPIVSAKWTGEEETMQWLQDESYIRI